MLGAGAALVAIKAYFPEPKARAYVIDAARKQLGREVRLTRIDAGLTGLHLQGLAISERPDFAAGTFLSAETVSVRPSWKALMQRKLVVASASAEGLKVSVVRNADGSFNYDTLASSAATPAPAAQTKPEDVMQSDFNVRRLRVAHGEIDYRDAVAGTAWAVTGLSLKLDDFSLADPFDLDLALHAKGKAGERPVDASLAFTGTVHPARGMRDKIKLEFKRLSVEQDGLKLSAKGKISNLDAPDAALDVTLSASGKTLLEANGSVHASSPGDKGARTVDADLKLKTPGLDTTLLAKWVPGAGIPALSIPAADAAVVCRWEGTAATVKTFHVAWADSKIDGSALAKELGSAAPVYEGKAKFGVDVPEIRAGQYSFIKLPPKSFIPAMRLDGEASYEGGDLTLASFAAKFKQGTASASGVVRKLASAKPIPVLALRFAVDLPSFKVSELPVAVSALPANYVVPAMRLDGATSYGDGALTLTSFAAKFKQGTVSASGVVRKLDSAKPAPDLALRFAVDIPSFKISELPVAVAALPADYVVPAMRLDGGARAHGDDLALEKVSIKGKSGTLHLDGRVAKALAGAPEPDLEIQADLDLPALTDKDLPFSGVPPGLELPPSRWDADLSYTPKAIRLRKFGVKIASNEIFVEGGISDPAGRGAFDLLFKCKRFVLEELTRLTPQTRDLKLAGSGFFAVSVTGTKDKPVYGGKLQFKDVGATMAELPLSDFTGTISFDERRVDIPNLKGKVADGSLSMDLTIKDYTKVPDILLDASLDRFDLGKFLSAQKKLQQDAQAAKDSKAAKTGKPAEVKPATPFRTSGKLAIGALLHPNAQIEKVTASWDLSGVTPDMKKLDGEAKFGVDGGKLRSIKDLAVQSPVVKVLTFPILIFQKLSFGVDFNNITELKIVGDYAFKDGVMTLRQSEMDSSAAQVTAVGTINLPAELLDLIVTAKIGNVAPVDVAVTGTVASPKTKVKLGKFLGDLLKR